MSDDGTRMTETRRTMLKYLGAAVGFGTIGAQSAVNPWAHPVAALQSDEDAFTTEERRIESFDGTELDATLYTPDAQGPHPAVLMTHGWGGDKRQLRPLASVYASREYVVLAYTSRGFGQTEDSDGSGGEVNSTSELEQQDAQHLIGWLAGRDAVLTDGEDNPRIGMDGVSYGGGIQLRTAAHDDRLDAIVPRATWNNLVYSLAPNGVIKQGWLRALQLGANQAAPTGNVAPEVEATSAGILERGSLTEEDREFYRSRSPVTYPEINTPTLLIPEWTDQLFPINEAVANFRKLQGSETETTLLIGQDGTHILGQGEDFPPGSETSQQFVGQQAIAWLDAHLKGDGEHGLSTFHYYDESDDEFRAADSFPPHERREISHTVDRAIELRGGDANVATIDRQITAETELLGIPTLETTVTPTGEGPSHLFVALQRVRDGETETIKEQVTPLRIDEAGEIELDLFGVQADLEPGDVLRVAMSAGEGPLSSADPSPVFGGTVFRNTPEGSGIELAAGTEVAFSVPASQPLPERTGVPTPAVDSLADAPGDPQTAAVHDVSEYGYVEEEYTISGTARPTVQDVALLEDEQPPIPDDVADYTTRMLVYRPEDPEQFNGDVLVEWMNVTQQRDAPVTAVNAYDYLLREGYAVALVSAQKVGVDDSAQDRDLVTWDAERYGDLGHPGDSYAYDIFSQTMQSVRGNPSTDPLDGLDVENVLATGMSQSGYYLQPYIAGVHPDHQVADGFMPVATTIFEAGVPATETPTLHLNTEDEAPSQAEDGDAYRLWEVAGASHVNVYLSGWFDVMDSRDFDQSPRLMPNGEWDPAFAGQYGQVASATYGVCGTNYYPVRYAYRAALDHLRDWVRTDEAPPAANRIEFEGENGEDPELVTDEYDNAVGGLRLPVIDEPVATYYARDEVCGANSDDPLASLRGATERLSRDQFTDRYADEEEYLGAVESAADDAVENGFLLAADREDLLTQAEAIDVPEQGETGGDGTETGTDDPETTDGTDDAGTTDGTGTVGGQTTASGPGFGIPAAAGGAGGVAYLLKRRNDASEDVTETEADD